MKRSSRSVAEKGVRLLENALKKNPPAGMSAERVAVFFQQNREPLTAALMEQLAQEAAPAAGETAGAPEAACGCRSAHQGAKKS